MSDQSLKVIQAVFAANSTVNLPVALAENVLEIRKWVEEELKSKQSA